MILKTIKNEYLNLDNISMFTFDEANGHVILKFIDSGRITVFTLTVDSSLKFKNFIVQNEK